MLSGSASTPCNPPAMVRPEKLAALRERMEDLGIREQDLEESFVRGSGRGGQKVNKTNNCVYLRHTPTGIAVKCHADRSRELNRFLARRELCDAVEQMQTGRCAKSPRHPAHEKAERQKEAQAFRPCPLSTGQRITERKSGISARNAEKPHGTSPSTWRIHCGGHSGSPGSPSLPAQSTLSPCWRTTPPYPGEASGTPYRPWGPYPH